MGVKLHPSYAKSIKIIQEKIGRERGAASWLAKKLSVSRQILFYWSKVGFPADQLGKIARITGLSKDELQTITVEFSKVDWDSICKDHPRVVRKALVHTSGRKSPPKSSAAEKTSFHGKRKSAPLTKERPMKAVGGFIPISAEELANQREEAAKAGADLSIRGRPK